jgi:hypothetical protein
VAPVTHDLTLKLYVNDISPAAADTSVSYTEMSTNAYVAKTLVQENWTTTSVTDPDGGDMAEAVYAQQEWTFDDTGGANTIYGYFIVDEDGDVMWAQRFDTPRVVGEIGDLLRLTPKKTYRSRPPAA